MKRFLSGYGVLVHDRLGHTVARQLAWQTGAQLVTAPFTAICADHLGRLSRVSHQIINGKSYVCFDGGPRPMDTLILCAVTEEAGDELKQVVNAANRALLRALSEQVVLLGAGTWQKHLADYLRELGRQRAQQLSEQLGCRGSDVTAVSDCMADSLERLSQLIRPQQQSDETASEQPEILDSLSTCVSGLRTAVSVTQSLLKLQFYPATASV